ncbi:MAG: CDP-alcohol phosphatidyltransferase family protein [Bacteroidetes bacterium]|nr:CDP-alcohol phosphatidyltransferase family protein [Bacteroidota bacterium]
MSKIKALIPHLFTAGNLLGGVLAIIFALTGRLEWAPYCIFSSAFLDFFDGFVARLLKVQSELGKQLDSLADMVTFGVAPGVIVFVLLKTAIAFPLYASMIGAQSPMEATGLFRFDIATLDRFIEIEANPLYDTTIDYQIIWLYKLLPLVALIIPVMSMFRLAKFNLDTRQSDSFIGVPTPANTLFFASIPLIVVQAWHSDQAWQLSFAYIMMHPIFLSVFSIFMSILLVAELPLFALKFKSFGWQGNEIRYIFLTLAVILLATLQWLAIPLIIILYLLLSIIQNLRLRQKATTDKFANKNEKIQS